LTEQIEKEEQHFVAELDGPAGEMAGAARIGPDRAWHRWTPPWHVATATAAMIDPGCSATYVSKYSVGDRDGLVSLRATAVTALLARSFGNH
jgi:hypothetical protein